VAQWNLSVDLRGRGQHLARTLRTNAGHARTLGAAVRRADTNIRSLGTTSNATAARLGRLATQTSRASRNLRTLAREIRTVERRLAALDDGIRIAVRLDDQTGGSTGLRQVQAAARDTARTLSLLRRRAEAAAAAFGDLNAQARLASGGLRSFNTSARTAAGRLDDLRTRTTSLTDAVTALGTSLGQAGDRLGAVNDGLNDTSQSTAAATSSGKQLLVVAGMLATALLPITASLAPIAAGLGAAGVAAGVFGIAIAGQIKALTDAAEAQTKYDEAVREHGKASPEAAEAELAQVKILKEMPAATREAAAAYEVLTDRYKAFTDGLAGDTMPVATKAMGIFTALLDEVTPLARGASRETSRFMTIVAGGIKSEPFQRFMDDFTAFAIKTLDRANTGLIRFSRALAAGQVGGNLREFFEYARANGPLVAETLSELGSALAKLLAAAADVGVGMLTIVGAFAKLVNAIPTEALSALLQLAVVMKAVSLAAAGLAAGRVAMAAFSAQILVMQTAAAGATGRMAALTAGFAAMSRGAKAALIGSGIGLLVIALTELSQIGQKAPADMDKMTTSIGQFAKTGKITGEAARVLGADMSSLEEALRTLARPSNSLATQQWLTQLANMDSTPVKEARDRLGALDGALADLVRSGNADLAAAALQKAAAGIGNLTEGELRGELSQYKQALDEVAFEAQLTADSMGVFGAQAQATSAKLAAQKLSADGLRQSIQALNETNRAALGGMIGFEQAIDDAAEAAAKNAGALTMSGGKLNLNSQAARDAATALQNLGTKTEEAAATAREANAPWAEVTAIYTRGQAELIKLGGAMGLSAAQAELLAASVLDIPDEHETRVEMDREDALAGLDQVIAKIQATPGAKSVTVTALTQEAMNLLTTLGYKTERLPDGQVKVTALTGDAISGISRVQAARDALSDRTITITTRDVRITEHINRQQTSRNLVNADGNLIAPGGRIQKFADGGMREQHTAQIARPRATYRIWAEPETGGEAYIPLAPAKRPRSRAIAEETIRRLGGDPDAIVWNADGNIHGAVRAFASGGFSYTPTNQRSSLGDVQSRYDETHQPLTRDEYNKILKSRADALDRLRIAEAKLRQARARGRSRAEVEAAERQVALARRALTAATNAAAKAEARYRQRFSLSDWAKTLKDTVGANNAWETNLKKIASRGGADVISMLRDMGEEGAAMVAALAKATNKQFNEIVNNLRRLGPLAKATLADFTDQLNSANKADAAFQANLTKLSAMGYGDLAAILAAQGDDAAMKLASEAARDKKKAAAADKAAKTNQRQLTQDELGTLVQIIAAVKTSKTGIHDVAATTGLEEDEIIQVASKAPAQIKTSLGGRATRFLSDLARAQKGLAYANGGIREGIYTTRAGLVTFAEPETGGEAYIPLGANKRSRALPVLHEAARRLGVGFTDLASRQIVVVKDTTGATTINVSTLRTGATAHDIAAEIDRQQRRARRGGVATR
jgi:hypothetical protein